MKFRLFDGHCDTAYELWKRKQPLAKNNCHIDLSKAAAFDAYAQVFAFCCCDEDSPEILLSLLLSNLKQEVERNNRSIAFARTKDEVLRTVSEGKAAALLSLEGAEAIDCDPDYLEAMNDEGFVMVSLTWNNENLLAGCHGSDYGLSSWGKAFVQIAQYFNILIDVSHLGERAFWDLIDITSKPIIASHSNCRALCDHTRNLTDDQLRAIAQTGGTVGLNFYTEFLGENADFESLLRHLEHMLSICGERHVALGGDLDGCDALAAGFTSVADYVCFYEFLQRRGFSEETLDRLFFTNLLDLL